MIAERHQPQTRCGASASHVRRRICFAMDNHTRQAEAVAERIKVLAGAVRGADPDFLMDYVAAFDPLISELREAATKLRLEARKLDSLGGIP